MSRIKNSSRPLQLEQLEARQLMAGDVSAAVVNGDLLISGNLLSNGLAISAGATPGTVQVSGLTAGGFATKVNHQTAPQTFAVAHDVVLNLGQGDDVVRVENVRIPGNLKIQTGDGSDSIRINNAVVARSLDIDTAAGNDSVSLSGDRIGGQVKATTGTGDDYFSLLGSHVLGNFSLNTGWNADRVTVQDSQFDYSLNIEGEASIAPKQITLANVQVRLALSVQSGDAHDTIRLSHVSANEILLDAGAGNDRVYLDWVTADDLSVSLGDGADNLSAGNSVARLTSFDGGQGTNHLTQPYANKLGTYTFARFS